MKTFSTEPRPEPEREVACALCGRRSFRPLWNLEGFSFSRCAHCGLVQQSPQPEPGAVEARYGDAYSEYEIANQEAYRDLELLALADLRLEEAAAPLRAAAPRPRALDVGCATGALLDALRDRDWEPQGVEICVPAAKYGRRRYGLPIHAGDLISAYFPDGSFELVHASHLVEHLNDPRAFLAEARRVLARDGLLVLATPNVDGFQARLLGSEWRSAIRDHLYLFSASTLGSLLSECGFRVERLVTWGGWARGQRPAFAKGFLDRWAKRRGRGDLMAVLARKEDDHGAAPRSTSVSV
jgi:SAM-dependent methyltransferase